MKHLTTKFLIPAVLSALTVSCGSNAAKTQVNPELIEKQLQEMTLREKVGQLFCVRPEAFDVALEWDTYTKIATYQLQAVNEQMVKVNAEYPAGGIILFAHNIKEKFPAMGEIGRSGDTKNALRAGKVIGGYLRHYGFDVDLAPVADVNTNPKNPVIGSRAFSDDPKVAADMVTAFLKGLDEAGVAGCVKHFPGHGDTQTDSHYGYAQTTKTWEEMLSCEMVTFKAAIKAGVPMIMTAHIGTPGVSGDELPATVNPVILTDKLRNELGYKGVIITDGMAMGAITRQYNSAEAAILSLQAGADIILGPKDFIEAFDAVLGAVENGTLSEERIDESVRRVLTLKASLRK